MLEDGGHERLGRELRKKVNGRPKLYVMSVTLPCPLTWSFSTLSRSLAAHTFSFLPTRQEKCRKGGLSRRLGRLEERFSLGKGRPMLLKCPGGRTSPEHGHLAPTRADCERERGA